MKNIILVVLVMAGFCANTLFAESDKKLIPGVNFANIKDGQTVSNPVKIEMSVAGKTVAPAGTLTDNTGHHHIIVDGSYIKTGDIIPADEKHFHFGKGQTETELTLSPGKHQLTLQFADGAHRSFGKAWSKTIQIEVK